VGRFGTGQAIRRVEDERLITGKGRYTDDITLPGQGFLYFLRSPYAHAKLLNIDSAAARSAPGVVAVFTADDLDAAGIGKLAIMPGLEAEGDVGPDTFARPALASGRARYVGDPIAAIVAESLSEAKDAAELVEVDFEELDAVADIAAAISDGAPQVREEAQSNSLPARTHGDKVATEEAFADAHRIVELKLVNNRLAPTSMEPRGCVASYDESTDKFTLTLGTQGVHSVRDALSATLGVAAEKVHVITADVGGGFGPRLFLDRETVVAAFAARELKRPVKWTADRTESFLSDLHGRDHVTHARLALDEQGHFLGLSIHTWANLGAYSSPAGPMIPWFGTFMAPGCYTIPAAYAEVEMVLTNTSPVDAYRGAGRPEALYLIERLVDKAARETGIAPDELRRRNFITPEAFPYQTVFGQVYDSGEYARLMDRGLERADWARFERRREEAAGRGMLRGIGMGYYVEICAMLGGETTHVKFEEDGSFTALVGTQSTGQGHETSFGQMIAAGLGLEIADIRIVQGDSETIPTGGGTGGSRSMAIGGSAMVGALETLIDAGKRMAASLLEATEADIEFDEGMFRVVGTDVQIGLREVALVSYDPARRPEGIEAGLYSADSFQPEGGTFPNGCHVCEVEVDPETGTTRIVRYTIEDDVGTVINPLILEGQIVGGVGQGLGQAMMEHALYDRDTAQLVTATFMDYTMPRADTMPVVDFAYTEIPSPRNPLGVKGAGEAGTIGAPPAIVNAVVDALSPLGITHLDMPLSPLKVWEAIRAAKRNKRTSTQP